MFLMNLNHYLNIPKRRRKYIKLRQTFNKFILKNKINILI